jgi:hypothetical protein
MNDGKLPLVPFNETPRLKRYNERAMALIQDTCLKSNEVHSVDEEFYTDFLSFSDREMELLIFGVILTTVDAINKDIQKGALEKDKDYFDHFVMLFLEMIAEGKVYFTADGSKYGFWAPLGDPPSEEIWNKIQEKIESCRPIIKKVLANFIDKQKPH